MLYIVVELDDDDAVHHTENERYWYCCYGMLGEMITMIVVCICYLSGSFGPSAVAVESSTSRQLVESLLILRMVFGDRDQRCCTAPHAGGVVQLGNTAVLFNAQTAELVVVNNAWRADSGSCHGTDGILK